MHDVPDDMCVIADWMIDLLEDDRPADTECELRVSDGLHWMYRASFVRHN